VVDKPPPQRTAIYDEEQINAIWKEAGTTTAKDENDNLNKAKQSDSKRSQSNLHAK